MSIPLSSEMLGSISPSRLKRLACPARISFEQAGAPHKRGITPSAGIGRTVHMAMDAAVRGSSAGRAWNEARSLMATEGFDVDAVPNGRRTRLRFERAAQILQTIITEFGPSERHVERRLCSTDGELEGTPDLVLVRSTEFIVVDYKSSLVLSDGEVGEPFVQQLQLYAYLAAESYRLSDGKALLLSLREGKVPVDATPELRERAASQARLARASYNARSPGAQPALPSPDNCVYCPYLCRCEAFWRAVEPTWSTTIGHAVQGTIAKDPEISSSGIAAVQLHADAGTLGSRTVVVGGIEGEYVAAARAGSRIALCGLRSQAGTPDVLRCEDRTILGIERDDAADGT